MDKYTLFLDESYTYSGRGKDQAFAIGGFIINDNDIPSMTNKITRLKNLLWSDLPDSDTIILHELEVKNALNSRCALNTLKSEYIRFRNNRNNVTRLYSELSKIIKTSDISVLGCVIIIDGFLKSFPKEIQNEISLVTMQIIIENYTHFLFKNKSIGRIVYESRDEQDKTMLMRFYQISSIGTMYVKPQSIQQKIYQFKFVSKKTNNNCLQLADFIPNQIARKKSGKDIYRNVKDLTDNILLKSYDGMNDNVDRYGIKVIPRIV